jgi:C4-dicarboxylate transporter DctQ subunit
MTHKIVSFLHRVEEGFLAFLLAGMAIITFSQVVARYVFNTGAVWALELTTFFFAWLVILGISYGVRIHSHIGVDAFVKLLGKPAQRIMGLLAVIAGLTYAILLLIGSWEHAFGVTFEFGFVTEDLKIPMWIPLSVMVFGFATMILRMLGIAWRIIVYKETGTMIADEASEAIEQFAGDDQPEETEADEK